MTHTKTPAHTPGPWVPRRWTAQEWFIDAPQGDPTIGHAEWHALASVYGNEDDPRAGAVVAEANARLIAAAPMLLDALQEVMRQPTNHPLSLSPDERRARSAAHEKAFAAIAAALGEAQ